jgi:hypothetical protein
MAIIPFSFSRRTTPIDHLSAIVCMTHAGYARLKTLSQSAAARMSCLVEKVFRDLIEFKNTQF